VAGIGVLVLGCRTRDLLRLGVFSFQNILVSDTVDFLFYLVITI
jgi:hypothetical protein